MAQRFPPVVSTVAGAAQFSSASAIVDFTEHIDVSSMPVTVNIVEYSYNSLGAAHDASLFLATAAGAAVNLQTSLESRTAINSFTVAGSIPVPRTAAGAIYQVFFSTTSKADDGTFRLVYEVEV